MKIKRLAIFAFVLLLALTACGGKGGSTTQTTSSNGLPTPVVNTTSSPDVSVTAKGFLDKWKEEDYAGMYAFLAKTSQDIIVQGLVSGA